MRHDESRPALWFSRWFPLVNPHPASVTDSGTYLKPKRFSFHGMQMGDAYCSVPSSFFAPSSSCKIVKSLATFLMADTPNHGILISKNKKHKWPHYWGLTWVPPWYQFGTTFVPSPFLVFAFKAYQYYWLHSMYPRGPCTNDVSTWWGGGVRQFLTIGGGGCVNSIL